MGNSAQASVRRSISSWWRILFLVGIATPLVTSAAWAGENYALLVAVADYDVKELRPLKYTRADVLAFHQALLESGFPAKNIVLMHDDLKRLVAHYEKLDGGRDPKHFLPLRANVEKQLELLLGRLRPDDSVVVAFSGHGVQFKGEKKSYYCPSDANLERKDSLVSFESVFSALKDCAAGRKLFLVDACQNDPLTAISRSRQTLTLESVTRPQTEAVPEGIIALFSCKAGQKSFELPELGHGVFFYHLLDGWKGKGDLNKDGKLSYQELAAYTEKQTAEYAATKLQVLQTPQLKAEFSGEWVLRDASSRRPATLPDAPKGSALRWLTVSLHDPSAFEQVAGQVNLIGDRSWQIYGDQLAEKARQSGKKLIATFHRKDFPDVEPKLFEFVRRNRDVVAAVDFLSPYTAQGGFDGDRQTRFGERLKAEFPGISYWVSYIVMPGGLQEPLPAIPPIVDVVTVDMYWEMTPQLVTEEFEKWLPAWIRRAQGRPIVMKWVSRPLDWKPDTGKLRTAPGTLQKFAEHSLKIKAVGIAFDQYGPRLDKWSPGLETDPTALREFQAISRTHGFSGKQ